MFLGLIIKGAPIPRVQPQGVFPPFSLWMSFTLITILRISQDSPGFLGFKFSLEQSPVSDLLYISRGGLYCPIIFQDYKSHYLYIYIHIYIYNKDPCKPISIMECQPRVLNVAQLSFQSLLPEIPATGRVTSKTPLLWAQKSRPQIPMKSQVNLKGY